MEEMTMKKALSLGLAFCLLLPAALGEPAADADADIEALLAGMTLEEKVGQMMLASFRIWKEVPPAGSEGAAEEEAPPAVNVTELNDAIRACIGKYHFGGTVLYAQNCRGTEQVLRLTADLQAASVKNGGLPMLIAVDQEGGIAARLGFGTTGPSAMALAAAGDPASAAKMAEVYGEELLLLGIQADYAPVMDVNNNPNNPVIGERSFSDDPAAVTLYGTAFLEGLHRAGAIATVKHFPGHGNTDADSHTGFPRIDSTMEELKAFELIPFRAAVDAGADMVMTAHIQYPNIEKETYISVSTGEEVYLPATMSRVILTDILRGDMGFDGVIVTDALDMDAISQNFTDADVIRLTMNAGVDMLMLPLITDTNQFRRVMDMTDTAIGMVENGEISQDRIDQSVRRILKLKKKYGMLDRDYTVTDGQLAAAVSRVGSEAHRQVAREIAEKALTLLRNENNAFPVHMQAGEKALILFADSCASRVGSGGLARKMLTERGALPEGAEITVMSNTRENGDECLQAAMQSEHVILVNRVYASACLDPDSDDGFSTAAFDRIIEARHAEGKPVIVVSCQLPYDAARFPDADAVLLTYGSTAMRAIPPASGEDSAYAPSLPAALCACFGQGEPAGILPVNLPKLDGQYRLTDEILYERTLNAGQGK